MSSVFEDAFTDTSGTLLTAHTPVLLAGGTGTGTWTFGTGTWVISDANRARNGGSGDGYATDSGTPASASYVLDADYLVFTVDSSTIWYGPLLNCDSGGGTYRMQVQLVSNGTSYDLKLVYFSPTNSNVQIGSTVAAGITGAVAQAGHIRATVSYPGSGQIYTYSVYLTRASDGNYLKSDGTWQSGQVAAIAAATYDDTSASGAGFGIKSPGVTGLGTFGLSGNSTGIHFDSLAVNNAGTLAISPTAVGISTTGTIALTGSDVTWTPGTPGSPTFTATTGTINSQQVLTSTTATINYTAPGTAGTDSITDPGGGSANLTIQPGLTAGVLAAVAGGSASIQLTSTTPSAGTSPYTRKLYRSTAPGFTPPGAGTLIDTQTSSSTVTWTDSTATAGQTYWYVEYVTDSASGATSGNETYGTLWQPTIVLGLVGDSNTANGFQYARLADLLRSARGPRKVTVVNCGVAGSTASQWVSGSTNMNAALAAIAAASCTHVAVCLGTNAEASVGDYTTAMANIVATLEAAGPDEWIFPCPFSGNDTIAADVISYRPVQAALDNGGTIRFIDDSAFALAAASFASGQTVLFSDSPAVHYTTAGGALAGDAMYRALDAVLYPAGGGAAGVRRVNFSGGFG